MQKSEWSETCNTAGFKDREKMRQNCGQFLEAGKDKERITP